MAQEKIFIGSCKVKETQYGELVSIGINEEDIKKLQENMKGGWVNLNFKRSQEGKPYLEVNTYSGASKPADNSGRETVRPNKNDAEKAIAQACNDDDLPF